MSRNFVNLTGTSSDNNNGGGGRKRPRKPVRPPPLSPANSNADEDVNDEHFYDQIHQKKVHKRNGVLIRGQWLHREGLAQWIRSRQAQGHPPTNLLQRRLTAEEVAMVVGRAAAQVQAVVLPHGPAAALPVRRYVYVRREAVYQPTGQPIPNRVVYFRLQLKVRPTGWHWMKIMRRHADGTWHDPHEVPGERSSSAGPGVFQVLLNGETSKVGVAAGMFPGMPGAGAFNPSLVLWLDIPGRWRQHHHALNFFRELKHAVFSVQSLYPVATSTLVNAWDR